jgi:hypothetical protein
MCSCLCYFKQSVPCRYLALKVPVPLKNTTKIKIPFTMQIDLRGFFAPNDDYSLSLKTCPAHTGTDTISKKRIPVFFCSSKFFPDP